MILLITGTREVEDEEEIEIAVCKMLESEEFSALWPPTLLIHGDARGIDRASKAWADRQDPPIEVKPFPAEWTIYRDSAGRIRNEIMRDYCLSINTPTVVLAFPHKFLSSNGTRHMIRICREKNMNVNVFEVPSRRDA